MTIRRGGDWGRLGTPPEDLPSARSDHEIGEHLGNAVSTIRLCGETCSPHLADQHQEHWQPLWNCQLMSCRSVLNVHEILS